MGWKRATRKTALYLFTGAAAFLLFSGLFIYPPFWPVLAACAVPAIVLWRLDVRATRRERAGCCAACGYDRRGLAEGAACPECGSAAPSSPPPGSSPSL